MEKQKMPHIPYDIYESSQELVILLPLGGVKKESVDIRIKDYRLVIIGERKKRYIKDNCVPLKEQCYRGKVEIIIDLPSQVYFDKIHSKLSSDNVLEIIVPKSIVPEKIKLEVEYDE